MFPAAASSNYGNEWAVASGRLEIGLAGLGTLRWVAADITLVLEEARRRLDLSPIAAVALGRSLTGAVLLQRIPFDFPGRIVLEVRGDGPLGRVIAEADSSGNLRGMVGNRRLPTPEDGRMRIAPLVGHGFLRVTREGRWGRDSSQVALVSGELGSDLARYLEQSEQIRSVVLLGVLPKPTGIGAAGGLVVEALPGTEDRVLDRLEANIGTLEGVSSYLDRGGIPALAEAVLAGFEREVVETQALEYRCRCTRKSLLGQLVPLAQSDLTELVWKDGTCETSCAYCGRRYLYSAEELTTIH